MAKTAPSSGFTPQHVEYIKPPPVYNVPVDIRPIFQQRVPGMTGYDGHFNLRHILKWGPVAHPDFGGRPLNGS